MISLATLLTAFVISGNQVIDLDMLHTTGKLSTPPDQFTLTSPVQRENNKWAITAVALDWPVDNTLQKGTVTLVTLQLLAKEYCSSHATPNQLHFLEQYAQAWQPNWIAGNVELGVLKRLNLQGSPSGPAFAEVLRQNPTNAAIAEWQDWYNMQLNREKVQAQQLSEKNHLDTKYACSSDYPMLGNAEMQVLGISHGQLLDWKFAPNQAQWFPSIIPSVNTIYLMAEWGQPGKNYERTWQAGPSWQITYNTTNNTLLRTATFIKHDSYIQGTIGLNTIEEHVIETDYPVTITQTQQHINIVH
jgi:hypothetical protein